MREKIIKYQFAFCVQLSLYLSYATLCVAVSLVCVCVMCVCLCCICRMLVFVCHNALGH